MWNSSKVAEWIERESGRGPVSKQRGWEYHKKLGQTPKVPRPATPRPTNQSRRNSKRLSMRVARLKEAYPTSKVKLWASDEHRPGLKPIIRRVWNPKEGRPIVKVHQRYQ